MPRDLSILAVIIVVGLTVPAAQAKKTYTTPTSAEDFEKIVTQLSAEAAAYAKREDDGTPPPSRALLGVQYVAGSAAELAKALKTKHDQLILDSKQERRAAAGYVALTNGPETTQDQAESGTWSMTFDAPTTVHEAGVISAPISCV
ncbi:hypothetical protein LCGC14_2738040, partial [marine sediment metagenome]